MVMFTGAGPSDRTRAGRVPFPPPGLFRRTKTLRTRAEHVLLSAQQYRFRNCDDNPAAIAIRFHVAQHAYLSHIDFHIGSGLAALTQIGNEAEDLHFYGGVMASSRKRLRPPGNSRSSILC